MTKIIILLFIFVFLFIYFSYFKKNNFIYNNKTQTCTFSNYLLTKKIILNI